MTISRNHRLALAAVAGTMLFGIGYNYVKNGAQGGDNDEVANEVVFSDVGQIGSGGISSPSAKVICHIVGGVHKPGVYTLPAGSRVFQAIKAAGGQTEGANVDALNLAAPIEDGSKIEVPTRIDADAPDNSLPVAQKQTYSPTPAYSGAETSAPRRSRFGSSSNKLQTPGEGTVNINAADPAGLTMLPGVGPSTAQKIVEYRSQTGRFATPEQLMDVKGIGPAKLAKMRPFVVCN